MCAGLANIWQLVSMELPQSKPEEKKRDFLMGSRDSLRFAGCCAHLLFRAIAQLSSPASP